MTWSRDCTSTGYLNDTAFWVVAQLRGEVHRVESDCMSLSLIIGLIFGDNSLKLIAESYRVRKVYMCQQGLYVIRCLFTGQLCLSTGSAGYSCACEMTHFLPTFEYSCGRCAISSHCNSAFCRLNELKSDSPHLLDAIHGFHYLIIGLFLVLHTTGVPSLSTESVSGCSMYTILN